MSFLRQVGRRARKTTDVLGRAKLDCTTHGKVTWYGDIVCAACGLVFLREGPNYPTAPEDGRCFCGVQLFPPRDAEGKAIDGYFSARTICRDCAKEAIDKAKSDQA